LAIGAGVTNTAMLRFLKKHGMNNFVIFNRTLEKAELLAEELGGKAYPLSELENYTKGFDILVSCTGSEDVIVDEKLYTTLLNGETNPKIKVDLALYKNHFNRSSAANFRQSFERTFSGGNSCGADFGRSE
jgi:glutamyl-tRNA reductase